ncbi:MAG: hypothetical protein OXC91_11235 [Rhodobacteraceae bacterium]|nr:hypothetical protein [Paracoccaceae bacterium]
MKRLTWKKAVRALQQIAGGRIGRRLVRVLGGRDPGVTFTIALSAKIAKIDGRDSGNGQCSGSMNQAGSVILIRSLRPLGGGTGFHGSDRVVRVAEPWSRPGPVGKVRPVPRPEPAAEWALMAR